MATKLLENQLSAVELVEKLLSLSATETVCLLDSCGVSHLDSHFLIAGIKALETYEITNKNPAYVLGLLDRMSARKDRFGIFTIAYDFGLALENITPRKKKHAHREPDLFLALFDVLIVHDYKTGETTLTGDERRFTEIENFLGRKTYFQSLEISANADLSSNFTKAEYLQTIEIIKERIRRGDTYQTNLTQQLRAVLPEDLNAQQIFYNLRRDHPAPFASFIKRRNSFVVSASPERFFQIRALQITTSPIKGTRPRGEQPEQDELLKTELLNSAKDRAENVMIVDLLRNDLGRICEFGSVKVEKLCDLEIHPTLFHLVSTVSGALRRDTKFSDVLRAVFPCGSITGAPKIRTMQIIDELENANRGLSMGAIGYFFPNDGNFFSEQKTIAGSNVVNLLPEIDLSVAIRTMVVQGREAVFNVGGGIVIDSIPELEYEETLVKAKALLAAINGKLIEECAEINLTGTPASCRQ